MRGTTGPAPHIHDHLTNLPPTSEHDPEHLQVNSTVVSSYMAPTALLSRPDAANVLRQAMAAISRSRTRCMA